jgi:hypothetical protein
MKAAIEFKRIKFELRSLGIKKVYIHFNGSGDDGDIEDIEFENDSQSNGQYDTVTTLNPTHIGKLKDLAYDMIDDKVNNEYGGDWINNDGGYGNICLDIDKNEYTLDYNQRTTDEVNWSGEI